MDLDDRLYSACVALIPGRSTAGQTVRVRGGTSLAAEIFTATCLAVHFVCVVHAVVHEGLLRDLARKMRFQKLADRWSKPGPRPASRSTGRLREETKTAFTELEAGLPSLGDISFDSRVDEVKKAVQEALKQQRLNIGLPDSVVDEIVAVVHRELKGVASTAQA